MSPILEKSHTIKNLSTYDAKTPVVSIVILNLNKPDMTIECLEALWEHTTDIAYEVIVVDNGSSPENQKKLAAYEGPHTLLPLAINRFFGEGNNIGAEAAKGEFVLFLNNDVIVTKGWLKPLVDVFDTYPDAGCSGPKFEYPSGELQEAGALLDENGRSVQIGKFQSPKQARFNIVRSVDYVSAATVLMRRKDFMTVLGFDFRYEPAYYEDCDLCLKIGSLGKKTYYVPQSRIIHHENATTADQSNALGLTTIVELNRDKFIKRWQTYLQSGQHAEPENFPEPISAPPASAKKTAAIFTPYNIIPGGGERYLLSVMKIFAEQGYALTLVAPELFSRIRITSVLEKLDLELPGLDIITYQEAEKRETFDLFYCLGNEVCPTSPALGKTNLYCCQFPFKSDPNELQRRLPWLSDYDALICYSAFVESAINEKLVEHNIDDIRAQVVSPPVGLVTDVDPGVSKSGVLGIGRFFSGGHCKRQDMMVEALGNIHDQGSAMTLDLVGSLHPEPEHRDYFKRCQSAAKSLPVKFHVDADPAVLAGLLQTASFYWHGAGLGVNVEKDPELCEHFGISVIEAMSARVIPIVVNNGGPSSIVERGVSGFHYSTQEELVSLTLDLASRSEQELDQLRDNAQARAQEYSFDGFRNRLVSVLNTALKVSTKR